MRLFRAVRDFTLNKLPLKVGDVVEFDGKRIIVNGRSFECPDLRGAIKAGWVLPEPMENFPRSPNLF